jgi:hypothetical protein
MNSAAMPKRQIPARIDGEILDLLRVLSDEASMSLSRYLENMLMDSLKTSGKLPQSYKPLKPQWGGKRAKKTDPTIAESEPLEGGD